MYNFINLDEETRNYMVSELNWAIKNNELYYSKRFLHNKEKKWQELLVEAAKNHDEHWLAFQLENNLMFKGFEIARKPRGGYTTKHVPDTASETLASGQFNRYYILGLCQRVAAEGKRTVEVYRAKESMSFRQESQQLIGRELNIDDVITKLRRVKSSLTSELIKPNSGLSVKL